MVAANIDRKDGHTLLHLRLTTPVTSDPPCMRQYLVSEDLVLIDQKGCKYLSQIVKHVWNMMMLKKEDFAGMYKFVYISLDYIR